MQSIETQTEELAGGWLRVKALIPPRVCGLPNVACAARVQYLAENVAPAAFDPITPQVAEATKIPRANFPPFVQPPNCDGFNPAAESRGINPPIDPEQEDDTGEPYVIPGCAAGQCGVD